MPDWVADVLLAVVVVIQGSGRMAVDFLEDTGNIRAIKEGYRSGALGRGSKR